MKKCDIGIKFCRSEKRIIVVFGDISGFKAWIKRSGRDNLISTFTTIAQEWRVFKCKADLYKTLGDGFMAVYEVDEKTGGSMAACIAKTSLKMCRKINGIIDDSFSPRPRGFRIRIAEGDGLRYQERCDKDTTHDYVSYYINMTKELLQVRETIPVIAHGNFKELLNGRSRKLGIRFKPMNKPSVDKTEIFDEDLQMLWAVEAGKRNKKRTR